MTAGTGGAQRRLPGMRVHRGVRVEMHDAVFRRGTLDAFQVRRRMHAQQLLERGERRVVIDEIRIEPLGDQVIVDGGQTLRAFRMMRAHVVQLAVAVGDEGSGCHPFSLQEPAHGQCVKFALSIESPRCFKR